MSAGLFDPYHRWLGIPPKDQPADHYRLLGIDRFESDPEVIRDGADRQMTHVRTYQLGEYSSLSQEVLNKLAAARVCLLNPETKAAYDARLRRQLGGATAAQLPDAPPALPPVPRAVPVASVGGIPAGPGASAPTAHGRPLGEIHPAAETASLPHSVSDASAGTEGQQRLIVVAVAAMLLVAVALGAAAILMRSGPSDVAVHPVDTESAAAPAPPPPPPVSSAGHSATSEPSLPHAGGGGWLDASTATGTAGSVTVRVVSARLGKARVLRMTGNPARSREDYLIVTLALENTDPEKAVIHAGWGGMTYPANRASVYDNLKNEYEPKRFAGGTIENEVRNKPIYAGEPLHDVLVFAPPDESFEYLRLTLPACALGQEGDIRFEIPRHLLEAPIAKPKPERRLAEAPSRQTAPPRDPVVRPRPAPEPTPRVARKPVPNPSEQERIRGMIDEIYDTAAPRHRNETRELVSQLAALAEESENSAERFVLCRRASELACEAGDLQRMLQLVSQIAAEFEVDGPRAQAALLERFAEQAASEDCIGALVVSSGHVIDEAMDAERFDLADALSNTLVRVAQDPAGQPFRGEVDDLRREVLERQRHWTQVQTARQVLESDPDDAEAHTILARWYSFVCDDWDVAMPHWAKGTDPQLRALAEQELRIAPHDVAAQVDLADAWWEFALKAASASKPSWESRAVYWYEKAWPQITLLLQKEKVRKRLEELGRPDPDRPRPAGGHPAPGDPGFFEPGERRLSDLMQEPQREVPKEARARDEEEECSECNGKGVIFHKCPNRMCARGTVRDYRINVVGRNPVGGQNIVQRVPIRVPCPVCRGNHIRKEQCPACGGRGKR